MPSAISKPERSPSQPTGYSPDPPAADDQKQRDDGEHAIADQRADPGWFGMNLAEAMAIGRATLREVVADAADEGEQQHQRADARVLRRRLWQQQHRHHNLRDRQEEPARQRDRLRHPKAFERLSRPSRSSNFATPATPKTPKRINAQSTTRIHWTCSPVLTNRSELARAHRVSRGRNPSFG